MNKTHPHQDPRHVMTVCRKAILGFKRKHGTARGLVVYRDLVNEYLLCKRDVIEIKRGHRT